MLAFWSGWFSIDTDSWREHQESLSYRNSMESRNVRQSYSRGWSGCWLGTSLSSMSAL